MKLTLRMVEPSKITIFTTINDEKFELGAILEGTLTENDVIKLNALLRASTHLLNNQAEIKRELSLYSSRTPEEWLASFEEYKRENNED